jgi:hypothetical protein
MPCALFFLIRRQKTDGDNFEVHIKLEFYLTNRNKNEIEGYYDPLKCLAT